jgi:chromosome segregation ATPase
VARLFKVKDLKNYELAISTIIGAKLRNVVVANHTVSRDLLQYKAARDLVSYMPLNKLQYRIADD